MPPSSGQVFLVSLSRAALWLLVVRLPFRCADVCSAGPHRSQRIYPCPTCEVLRVFASVIRPLSRGGVHQTHIFQNAARLSWDVPFLLILSFNLPSAQDLGDPHHLLPVSPRHPAFSVDGTLCCPRHQPSELIARAKCVEDLEGRFVQFFLTSRRFHLFPL